MCVFTDITEIKKAEENLRENESKLRAIVEQSQDGITLIDEKGSIIDLKKPAGESVESYVNGRILGKGEVMVYEKNLAIRINEILDSSAVLYHLAKEKDDE